MEQKIVIGKSDNDINEFLDKGWKVVSVTAQHIAITSPSNGNDSYGIKELRGNFCFVLERNK